jgi:hypothetical protein
MKVIKMIWSDNDLVPFDDDIFRECAESRTAAAA